MLRGWKGLLRLQKGWSRPPRAAPVFFRHASSATSSTAFQLEENIPKITANKQKRQKGERPGKPYPVDENDIRNHRAFCDKVAEQLGFGNKLEGWYNVSNEQFCSVRGGSTILTNYYYSSPIVMLSVLYPEHKWECWRFSRVTKGCWNKMANQRAKMDDVAAKLGIKRFEDWYSVSTAQAHEAGAGGLVTCAYGGSIRRALRAIYTEHEWQEWKFSRVANGWFYQGENAKQCIDWVGAQLGVRKPEDWYEFRLEDIYSHIKPIVGPSGRGQLCIQEILRLAYPQHKWIDWLFKTGVPDGYWYDMKNQRLFCDWVGERLGIKHPTDWLKVTSQEFMQVGGTTLLTNIYSGSVGAMVRAVYNEYPWDAEHK